MTARKRWAHIGFVLALSLSALVVEKAGRAEPPGHVHEHGMVQPPKGSPLAERLWKDVVCLCGRCPRLPLAACHCPDAVKERQHIEDMLRARDLSSAEAQESAYAAVVSEYVTRFGGRDVLASASQGSAWGPWLALAGALAGVGFAIVAIERNRRRAEIELRASRRPRRSR